MALGPGKYDEACTAARETLAARGVVLIVFGGMHGNGFSCQAPLDLQVALPGILRTVADSIEKDLSEERFLK
jgi:hypothetical protein